ncbi:MAG TPA: DUF3806 domain-containing protein [Gemmatimonadaceae bacterium]|nr:DUF3806 domain-containing protein [Gemmatimonadaceae bacterium]
MGLRDLLGKVLRAGASGQTVSPLTTSDTNRLVTQRAVIEQYLGDDQSRENYKQAAGKLGTIRALLEQNVFQPNQTYELQCMGIVLGDAFVQHLGMEWIMVQDERGNDPAVRLPGTTLILYPLTMISKRVERGETVDVFDLFNGVADQVGDLRK